MEGLEKRKLITRRELPLLALIPAAAAGLLFWMHSAPAGTLAVLEVEGQVIAERELGLLTEPEELDVAGAGGVRLRVEFSREGARIVEADCPDRTCQRAGMLTQAGDCAVCLPGRVVLRLEGESQPEIDAQTY